MSEPTSEISETTETTEGPPATEPEMFGREYVERLRGESAEYRTRAARADALEARLVEALAAGTGVLADPADLARYVDRDELVDDDGNPDPVKVKAAVDVLVAERQHLRSRRPSGDVGQGARPGGGQGGTEALSGLLRGAVS